MSAWSSFRIGCPFFVAFIASPGHAISWYVDGSVAKSGNGRTWGATFKTIQEEIDAAYDGDAVVVAKGNYLENIRFNGKNIALRSTDPLDPAVVAATIINGGGKGSVVRFSGTEDQSCVLSGFTIRNGSGTIHPRKANTCGGGIYGGENPTGATIENNVITQNSAGYGGGIFGCNGYIYYNVITRNSAEGGSTLNGGGGLAFCNGTIDGNTVSENSVLEGQDIAFGGGR